MKLYKFVNVYFMREIKKRGDFMSKEKIQNYSIIGILSIIVIVFSVSAFVLFTKNEVVIENDTLVITGSYGTEWKIDDIEDIYLNETIPNIKRRTNGASFGNRKKGNFELDFLGRGKLFVQTNKAPFLFIIKKDEYIIISGDSEEITKEWHDTLQQKMKKQD